MVRLLCRACRYHASTSERGVNAEVERGVGGGDVLAGNVVPWSASEVAAHGREGIA